MKKTSSQRGATMFHAIELEDLVHLEGVFAKRVSLPDGLHVDQGYVYGGWMIPIWLVEMREYIEKRDGLPAGAMPA